MKRPGSASAALKRAFDFTAALVGMLLLAPVFAWLAWRVKRDSPGPVFYFGPRVGRGGKIFRIVKFRTMREEAASYRGPRVTAAGDARITPLGKWLRDTKLNELPQLWNVLKGEMSLVGPRPEDPEIARDWPQEAAAEVLSVRPGITSPASVLYRDEEKLLKPPGGIEGNLMQMYLGEIQPSKLRLDQMYVRHRSFWTDLDIIFWTALVLLPKMGEGPDEVRLLRGPLLQLMNRHVRWFFSDALVSLAGMGLAGLIFRAMAPLDRGWNQALLIAVGFALLFSITNALSGANRNVWSSATANEVFDLAPGILLATGLALGVNSLLSNMVVPGGKDFLPNGMILLASLTSLAGFVVVRYRGRLLTGLATRWLMLRGGARLGRERVLILGGGETGQYAAWKLGHGYYANSVEVAGIVDDDLNKQGSRIRGLNVLGRSEDLARIVKQQDIGVIVFAIHNLTRSERKRLLELCQQTGAKVMLWPDMGAAFNAITRHEQMRPLTRPRGEPLPCDLCLVKLSPWKIEDWLELLDETAQRGDLEELREQLSHLLEMVRPDVERQDEANK